MEVIPLLNLTTASLTLPTATLPATTAMRWTFMKLKHSAVVSSLFFFFFSFSFFLLSSYSQHSFCFVLFFQRRPTFLRTLWELK